MPNFLCTRSPSSNSWVRVGDRVEGYLMGEYLHVQTIIRTSFPQYVRSRYLARNFRYLDGSIAFASPRPYSRPSPVPTVPQRSLEAKVWPPVSKKKYGLSFKKVVVMQ